MITKYFSSVVVRMPAMGPAAKLGRVFLAQIPPRRWSEISVNLSLQPQNAAQKPTIEVKFKDGQVLTFDPSSSSTIEMVELFDRHSRQLSIKEQLNE